MRREYQQIKEVNQDALKDIFSKIKSSKNFREAKKELRTIITLYAEVNESAKKRQRSYSVKSIRAGLTTKQLKSLYKRLINFMNKYIYQDNDASGVLFVMYLTGSKGQRVRITSKEIDLTNSKENSLTIMGDKVLENYDKVIKQAEKNQQSLSEHFSKFSRAIASKKVPKLNEKGEKLSFSQSNVPEAFEHEFQYRHRGSLEDFKIHNHSWFIEELSLYYQASVNNRAWYTGQDLGNLQVKGVGHDGGRITLASTDSMLTLLKRLERIFLSDNDFENEFTEKEQAQILRELERKDGHKQVAERLWDLEANGLLIGEIDTNGKRIRLKP